MQVWINITVGGGGTTPLVYLKNSLIWVYFMFSKAFENKNLNIYKYNIKIFLTVSDEDEMLTIHPLSYERATSEE